MAPKAKRLEHLNTERKFVIDEIRDSIKSKNIQLLDSKTYNKRFESFKKAYDLTEEQKNNPELMKKIKQNFEETYENSIGKMNHICRSISIYKQAKAEHEKLLKSENASNTLKKISENNLKDYEEMIFSTTGITEREFKLCLATQNFENAYKVHFGDVVNDSVQKFAKENNLKLNYSENYYKDAFAHYKKPVKEFSLSSSKEYDVMKSFIVTDPRYYKNFPIGINDYPYSPTDHEFKYYKVVDGQYVDRPYPKGFFAKIGFFLGKLFSNEKKIIEAENKALESASDYAKTNELVGDLSKYEESIKDAVGKETTEFNKELEERLIKDKEKAEERINSLDYLKNDEKEADKAKLETMAELDDNAKKEKEVTERNIFEKHLVNELNKEYEEETVVNKYLTDEDVLSDESKTISEGTEIVGPGLEQVD